MDTTLFNRDGKPVAYIAEDGESIYTWDGRPVAYIYQDKLYGWNGRHLGWFQDGTVFDIFGYRAGFVKNKSPVPVQLEPVKLPRQPAPPRQNRQEPAVKPPSMHYGYSSKLLEDLLARGVST
jgi:hypothetical protein